MLRLLALGAIIMILVLEKELDYIKKNNIEIRYLGENILKAETAPIFVSSIVKNHFGKI